jgi:hypothetical protein
VLVLDDPLHPCRELGAALRQESEAPAEPHYFSGPTGKIAQ